MNQDQREAAPDQARRELLQRSRDLGVAAAVMALLGPGLLACRREPTAVASAGAVLAEPEAGPYQVWREIQAALRASPDHSVARARALVQAGDADALLRFVRDEIRLVSAAGSRYFSLGSITPWGTRIALRAGAGTAREKADLLADLLTRAGLDAQVVQELGHGSVSGEPLFFRDFEQPFEPALGSDLLADWRRRLGRQEADDASVPDIDADGRKSAALAAQLLEVLEPVADSLGAHRYDPVVGGDWPLVQVTAADGSVRYADPIRPDGGWIETRPSALIPARAADGMLQVGVKLLATTTDPAAGVLTLAEAGWPADVLAGRQLRLHFAPAADFTQLLNARIGDLRNFTPVLQVQALDDEPIAPEHAHVVGTTFSVAGQQVEVGDDGTVRVDGQLLVGTDGPADPARVHQLEISADASRFPEVRLLATPRDEQGEVVEGLPASAFRVLDEEEGVGFTLASNNNAPRVLFLADQSGSMPDAFIGHGTAMRELVERVRERARTLHPGATVEYRSTDSSMWEHLAKAAATPSSLIIYATDGDLAGATPDAAMLEVLGKGPPALILDATGRLAELRADGGENIFDAMAAATGGEAHAVLDTSVDQALDIIGKVLAAHRPVPVQITYGALGPGRGERRVRVELGAASAEASYVVPETANPPARLASLRLVVEVDRATVERVLAGHDGTGPVTPAHHDDTLGALLGTHLIAFEGPPPSSSVLLDDVLQAKLALEPLDRAAASGQDLDAMLAAMQAGSPLLPPELATLLQRTQALSGTSHSGTQEGLRAVLYSAYPVINADRVVQRVDILPLEGAGAIAADPREMRRRAITGSAALAVAEAALFPQSTLSLLGSRPLALMDAFGFGGSDLPEPDRARWSRAHGRMSREFPGGSHMIVPADGSVHAFWAVDRAAPSVLGVLPDGSGGGRKETEIRAALAELKGEMERYNDLLARIGGGMSLAMGALNPVGGVAIGVVAAYGQMLVRLYAAASMSILLLDNSGMEASVRHAIASFACDVSKTIGVARFGAAGRSAAHAANLFSVVDLVASPSAFSCNL